MMVCFAGGIFLASHFTLHPVLVYLTAALAATILALTAVSAFSRRIVAIALFLLCACVGAVRLQYYGGTNEFSRVINTKIQLDGEIASDVDVRTDRQQLTFRPYGYNQRIMVFTSKYQSFSYGDRIVVSGKVSLPRSDEQFDYAAYLRRFNVYATMSYPKIMVVKTEQGSWIPRFLLNAKHAFVRRVSGILSDTESSLLLGILIGARKKLPQEVIDNFNATGTSHIIAISGYNISIIIAGLAFMARLVGRRWNMWLTLVVVVCFVVASGGSSSVVRAALMGALVLLASSTGRMYAVTPSLCLAACAMLIWNPFILYWDASFQLSFLATAGIVYLAPLLEKLTEGWPQLFGIKTILITTFAAIIATLPLILHNFGRLSLVAPIANVVVLPIVPLTMLLGFLTALPVIGPGFGMLAGWLLRFILTSIQYLAHAPYAWVSLNISTNQACLMYGVIVAFYLIAVTVRRCNG